MTEEKTEQRLAYLAHLRAQRDEIHSKIHTVTKMLAEAYTGSYTNGTISQVKKQKINVRAYIRGGYRIIRTK